MKRANARDLARQIRSGLDSLNRYADQSDPPKSARAGPGEIDLFRFADAHGRTFRLQIVAWRAETPDNFYVVLGRKRTDRIIEIHEAHKAADGGLWLTWAYSPKRHTGDNAKRREAFKHLNGGSETCEIPFPQQLESLDVFLDRIADLIDRRERAHEEGAEDPSDPESPEGKRVLKLHTSRERNRGIVKKAKEAYRKKNGGRLPCQGCDMDFGSRYGELGEGFIEAHHSVPLSELEADETVVPKISHFNMLCSNCHRVVHLAMPCLTLGQLRELLTEMQAQ